MADISKVFGALIDVIISNYLATICLNLCDDGGSAPDLVHNLSTLNWVPEGLQLQANGNCINTAVVFLCHQYSEPGDM